jgi:hypothetical protein
VRERALIIANDDNWHGSDPASADWPYLPVTTERRVIKAITHRSSPMRLQRAGLQWVYAADEGAAGRSGNSHSIYSQFCDTIKGCRQHLLLIVLLEDAISNLQSGRASDLRYAALSYCWGSTMSFTTTLGTIAAHQDTVPIARLAVLVARQLGLRFLWIDALCIIQDDPLDWERESAQMPYIFAYAFVTIGATASSACDKSFLQRYPDPVLRFPFQSTVDTKVCGEYSMDLEPYRMSESPKIRSSVWNTRAWIYQEQRLATRLLLFGVDMIQMHCRSMALREDGSGLPYSQQPDLLKRGPRKVWSVDEYSSKKLTYRQDRLAAVSGVARLLRKVAGEEEQFPICGVAPTTTTGC